VADPILNQYRAVTVAGDYRFGVREAPWGVQRARGAEFHGALKELYETHPGIEWTKLDNESLVKLIVDELPSLIGGFYGAFVGLIQESAVYYGHYGTSPATDPEASAPVNPGTDVNGAILDGLPGSAVIELIVEILEEHRRLFEGFFNVARTWKTMGARNGSAPVSTPKQPSSSDSSGPASLTAT
jgi:hypothetical protein